MKSMKEQISDMVETLINNVGDTTIKISEKAMGKCFFSFVYEPKIPIQLLKDNMDK